jgi:hypothetical protein
MRSLIYVFDAHINEAYSGTKEPWRLRKPEVIIARIKVKHALFDPARASEITLFKIITGLK